MKPNKNFEPLTLKWWNLTTKHIKDYVEWYKATNKGAGDYLVFSKQCRRHLKELCQTRREVFRDQSVLYK